MSSLAEELKGKALVLAVDANVTDTPQEIEGFLKIRQLGFPVVIDPAGGLVDRLGIKQTTTTLIFDRAGAMRYFGRFGYGDEHFAAQAVSQLLAGQPVAQPTTPLEGCRIPRPAAP